MTQYTQSVEVLLGQSSSLNREAMDPTGGISLSSSNTLSSIPFLSALLSLSNRSTVFPYWRIGKGLQILSSGVAQALKTVELLRSTSLTSSVSTVQGKAHLVPLASGSTLSELGALFRSSILRIPSRSAILFLKQSGIPRSLISAEAFSVPRGRFESPSVSNSEALITSQGAKRRFGVGMAQGFSLSLPRALFHFVQVRSAQSFSAIRSILHPISSFLGSVVGSGQIAHHLQSLIVTESQTFFTRFQQLQSASVLSRQGVSVQRLLSKGVRFIGTGLVSSAQTVLHLCTLSLSEVFSASRTILEFILKPVVSALQFQKSVQPQITLNSPAVTQAVLRTLKGVLIGTGALLRVGGRAPAHLILTTVQAAQGLAQKIRIVSLVQSSSFFLLRMSGKGVLIVGRGVLKAMPTRLRTSQPIRFLAGLFSSLQTKDGQFRQ